MEPRNEKFYAGSYCLIKPERLSKDFEFVTGKNVKAAVIDSGCDTNQMSDPRLSKGISFINNDNGYKLIKSDNYSDQLGHGSACIDIILQIAPSVEIIPIKVFGSTLETSTEILVAAINYAIDNGAHVINLSLGTKLEEALYPLYIICEKARKEKVICISSNSNSDLNSYPAIFENVISVRTGKMKSKFDFVYSEDEISECEANGFHEDAFCLSGGRKPLSGNSFAAPIISGFVSLLIEKCGTLSLESVRELLKLYSINRKITLPK